MKKINLIIIIICTTVVCVFNMVYYSKYINNQKYYEVGISDKKEVVGYNKAYIYKEEINNDNKSKEVRKVDNEIYNKMEDLKKADLAKKKLLAQQKTELEKSNNNSNVNPLEVEKEKNSVSTDIPNDIYLNKTTDNFENYNSNTKEQELSVFKVSSGKIQENLTTSDKIKLLYVSFQLGKESYKKVEEYLYAEDSEGGVLKALKLLKDELSKKEYEKVRKIAGRFIDMDAAEKLK